MCSRPWSWSSWWSWMTSSWSSTMSSCRWRSWMSSTPRRRRRRRCRRQVPGRSRRPSQPPMRRPLNRRYVEVPGATQPTPLFRVPTGLAVGLALKESRYAGVRRFAPSAAVALMGSPFPGRRIGRGFGWVIFGRAAYINRKINVTAGVMTPRVAMISGARAGLNGDADTPAHARVFDQRAASACGSGGSLRPRQSAAGGQRGEDCRMQPRRRRRRCGDGRGAGAAGLAARRHGCRVTLRGASVELRQLLEFSGLWPVLGG